MDATSSLDCPARHGAHLSLSEHTALNVVRGIVRECCNSVSYGSARALGRALAEKQLLVTVRTSLPNGFHSLRHQYLLVQTQFGGAAIVVDLEFRDRFHYTGLPGGTYAACVTALPQLMIGTMASVTAIVSLMADALEREAAVKRHDLPPWRTRHAVLANWLPECFTDDVYAPPGAALHPVLLHTSHIQPHRASTAFQAWSPAALPTAVPPPPAAAAAATAGAGQALDTVPAAAGLAGSVGGLDDGAATGAHEDMDGSSLHKAHRFKRKAEHTAGIGLPTKSRSFTSSPSMIHGPLGDTSPSSESSSGSCDGNGGVGVYGGCGGGAVCGNESRPCDAADSAAAAADSSSSNSCCRPAAPMPSLQLRMKSVRLPPTVAGGGS
ncbi:hypothetical protein VOLCADRAFT_87360 [Volvox carteri f. nagariensis]|uniref:Uncharacterized protein n=1 Tax=Volvox carteri f. nagariensis TaxID=3068 RepID=D8TL54_VOLCA|nr:uncharacterized protein VOLCADRAFT_87360 [Volvox carteri f. nagariensis]EFJ51810.1 hypothetical protein VOLCADRAFT_87360 [Volvox carteri f. nagariensis]|eukprot:XP_002947220.1 hypothetical protein VOLCADRAFT_87360 [Volvox carteri f. nagariensis]